MDKTYSECIAILSEKYGEVEDDYFREKSYNRFLNNEIRSITKGKYSKAKEGLECHHIYENQYIDIGNKEAIRIFKYPFYIQKKENLIYCDVFEHLILHVLIEKETQGEFGCGGAEVFLIPKIIDWFVNEKVPKPHWMKACIQRAYLEVWQANKILEKRKSILKPINDERNRQIVIRSEELRQERKLAEATSLGMTIEEYEQYKIKEEEDRRKKEEEIQNKKIEKFHNQYPELKNLNIFPDISRKKLLDLLLDYGYNNTFLKKKDYYDSMKKYYKDELYCKLNKVIEIRSEK